MHEFFVSLIGDLCEIFLWEKYGSDAHEIDPHPLNLLYQAENVDILSEITKARVNPISKLFLNHLFQLDKIGFAEVSQTSMGLRVRLGKEVEKEKEFLLSFPEYLKLFSYIRAFVYRTTRSAPDPRYGTKYLMDIANSISKKIITDGDVVYLVENRSGVFNTIKQIFSQLVGLGALINNDVTDSLIEKIRDKMTKKWNPYNNENYQNFLERAIKDRLHPIRICGRCTDIREEQNRIVLYVEGDGAVRVYTYKDCYKVMNSDDLDEKLLTVDGIPYQNHGIPVIVALRIIRRRQPKLDTI